jgi:hypothetical protein
MADVRSWPPPKNRQQHQQHGEEEQRGGEICVDHIANVNSSNQLTENLIRGKTNNQTDNLLKNLKFENKSDDSNEKGTLFVTHCKPYRC